MNLFRKIKTVIRKENKMISTNKAIAGLVFITLMNGFVSVNMFTNQSKFYSKKLINYW